MGTPGQAGCRLGLNSAHVLRVASAGLVLSLPPDNKHVLYFCAQGTQLQWRLMISLLLLDLILLGHILSLG